MNSFLKMTLRYAFHNRYTIMHIQPHRNAHLTVSPGRLEHRTPLLR